MRALLAFLLLLIAAPALAEQGGSPRLCPSAPELVATQDFIDPLGQFAPGSRWLRATRQRFDTAFRRVCMRGFLNGWAAFAARAAEPDRVFLRNRAGGEEVSLRVESEEEASRRVPRLILEFGFLNSHGYARVPPVRDIVDAIVCSHSNQGSMRSGAPLPQTVEGFSRCLPGNPPGTPWSPARRRAQERRGLL